MVKPLVVNQGPSQLHDCDPWLVCAVTLSPRDLNTLQRNFYVLKFSKYQEYRDTNVKQ